MTLADKLNRFVTRYTATLDWQQLNPMTWITHTEAPELAARIVRRDGCWWLYTARVATGAQAQAVKLHPNITKAKRMAESALAEPWLLDWPADKETR